MTEYEYSSEGWEIHDKAIQYRDALIEKSEEINRSIIANAFGKIKKDITTTIISAIEKAISDTKEFDFGPLKDQLIKVFSKDGIIKVTSYGRLYEMANEFAGTYSDFQDGINYARTQLHLGGLSKKKAAAFWKDFIYSPFRENSVVEFKSSINKKGIVTKSAEAKKERATKNAAKYYKRTIAARLSGWGNLAPYWQILEFGNLRSNLAYPRFGGTYFLLTSLYKLQDLFDDARQEMEKEVGNELNSDLLEFLYSPGEYEPGHIFDTMIVEGRKYYIYVTKERRLGTAMKMTL